MIRYTRDDHAIGDFVTYWDEHDSRLGAPRVWMITNIMLPGPCNPNRLQLREVCPTDDARLGWAEEMWRDSTFWVPSA